MKIRPKKWDEFQHYKDVHYEKGARPAWVKLHRKLLDDVTFQRLPRASQALAPMLWLIASEHPDGWIDANPEDLAFRLRWPETELSEALSPLIDKGFFEQIDASITALGTVDIETRSEERREEEKRKETPLVPLTRDGGRARKAEVKGEALQYLDFLNAKAGKHFRPVPSNLRFIEARLREGIPLQDLKTLTVRKCREWLGTDQEKYLRPETLCNATKCHSYLGEIPPEVPPCNAPDAIDPSSPHSAAAPAAGNSPARTPPPPLCETIRSVGAVAGSVVASAAITRPVSAAAPRARDPGTADITSGAETPSSDNGSSRSREAGPAESPYPRGAVPLH